jgi:hypothetical protein
MNQRASSKLQACGLVIAALLAACSPEPATREQCRAIFDVIVDLELREMGFADPLLTQRRQEELAQRYAMQLEECAGKPLPEGAMRCIESAASAEQVSHHCLGSEPHKR